MVLQYLQSVHGIELFGIISLLISIVAFLALTLRAWRADGLYVQTMEELPLDSNDRCPDTPQKAQQ